MAALASPPAPAASSCMNPASWRARASRAAVSPSRCPRYSVHCSCATPRRRTAASASASARCRPDCSSARQRRGGRREVGGVRGGGSWAVGWAEGAGGGATATASCCTHAPRTFSDLLVSPSHRSPYSLCSCSSQSAEVGTSGASSLSMDARAPLVAIGMFCCSSWCCSGVA